MNTTILLMIMLKWNRQDLDILDKCSYNIEKIIDNINSYGLDITLENIFYFIIEEGLYDFCFIIDERIDELKALNDANELSNDEEEELKLIDKINIFEDTEKNFDFFKSNIKIFKNKEIYDKYFSHAIDEFSSNTGFILE